MTGTDRAAAARARTWEKLRSVDTGIPVAQAAQLDQALAVLRDTLADAGIDTSDEHAVLAFVTGCKLGAEMYEAGGSAAVDRFMVGVILVQLAPR